ncbi:MAG TPA: hypothetical protein DEF51_36455 [Myxococcales bacterium]|nr:hypothetical protein [Myxococcales bacterium]
MVGRGLGWVALALALVACDGGGVSLFVEVRSDFVPGVEVSVIEVTVEGQTQESAITRVDDLAEGRRVAAFEGLAPSDARRALIRLLDADRAEVVVRPVVFAHRRDRVVSVILTRDCRDVACGPREACVGGSCQPEGCGFDEDACVAECASASECAPSTCALAACEEGVCFYTADDGACGEGLYCDPERGCLPDPATRDGGVPDAGPLDSGPPDAGPPPATMSRLAVGGAAWEPFSAGGTAPTEVVRAAFSPPGRAEIVALTDSWAYVLTLGPAPAWQPPVVRDSLLPELAGVLPTAAFAVPGTTEFFVYATEGGWRYDWDPAPSATLQEFTAYADVPAEWDDPHAPPWFDVRGAFSSPDDAPMWVTADTSSECTGAGVGRYFAVLSSDGFGPRQLLTSIYDIDCPFRWVDQAPYGAFAPFALPSAPAPFSITAVARPGDLYVFRTP